MEQRRSHCIQTALHQQQDALSTRFANARGCMLADAIPTDSLGFKPIRDLGAVKEHPALAEYAGKVWQAQDEFAGRSDARERFQESCSRPRQEAEDFLSFPPRYLGGCENC